MRLLIDGTVVATATAKYGDLLWTKKGKRSAQLGDDGNVAAAWTMLFDRVLPPPELAVWRSPGPAFGLDPGKYWTDNGVKRPRDYTDFHRFTTTGGQKGAQTDRPRLILGSCQDPNNQFNPEPGQYITRFGELSCAMSYAVEVPAVGLLGREQVSFAAWAKTNTSGRVRLLHRRRAVRDDFRVDLVCNKNCYIEVHGYGADRFRSEVTFPEAQWVHVVAVFDGTHDPLVFINGELSGLNKTFVGFAHIGVGDVMAWRIGRKDGDAHTNTYVDLKGVRLYPYALGAVEVSALHKGATKASEQQAKAVCVTLCAQNYHRECIDEPYTSGVTATDAVRCGACLMAHKEAGGERDARSAPRGG